MAKNIAASLFVKPPKQSTTDTTTRQQAVPGSYMNVPTDKIDFFDKNPRKHRDDESYEQIKASIRVTGVQHPVHITQRPDSDRFVLAQGGNTRLSIVKELWAETNDNRFASTPCIYVEYTSETDIQIAHLIENEQRQEMCFWDKAQAYSEIREIFQGATGKKLSLRECETTFATHGLSVSYGLLRFFFFANEKLQPLGKLAVDLSIAKTTEISKTYNDLKKRCKDNGKLEQEFEDWFVIALRDFAQYAETNTELDAGRLIEHLNISFSDYFDIQTANLFEEDESSTDTENSGLPESTLSGNLNNIQTPATAAVENDFDGSVKSRSSSNSDTVRTPRVPKEYSYGVSEPESVDNNEQDTATVLVNQPTTEPTMLPETVSQNLSGSHNGVSDTATVVYENIKEWQKALHSKVQKVLDITFLSKCFVASDLFPLGFYVEYPKFDILKAVIPNHPAMYVIDRQHQDAGDVWKMLAKLSGQEHFFGEINSNNPIMRLSDDSQFKQSFIDPEFEQRLILDLFGERVYLSDKIIRWLGVAQAQDELSLAIKTLFSTLQAKPHTGDS